MAEPDRPVAIEPSQSNSMAGTIQQGAVGCVRGRRISADSDCLCGESASDCSQVMDRIS